MFDSFGSVAQLQFSFPLPPDILLDLMPQHPGTNSSNELDLSHHGPKITIGGVHDSFLQEAISSCARNRSTSADFKLSAEL
jgi:hypothetical protein